MAFNTVQGIVEAEIVEKKSRFIAHLSHASTEEEALGFLDLIRKQNTQARHNVYAYILHSGRTRYSDDGEPAQTSGLPTFQVLQHAGIEDAICVTTRYFGGILLGTGGLVRAYTQAAQAALELADIVTVDMCADMHITVDYSCYQTIERFIREHTLKTIGTDFSQNVKVDLRVLHGQEDRISAALTELTNGRVSIDIGSVTEAVI